MILQRNACYVDHPILLRIASSLNESDKLLEFLTNHFEPALETPVKSKSMMALSLLVNAIKVVDSEMVRNLIIEPRLLDLNSHAFYIGGTVTHEKYC